MHRDKKASEKRLSEVASFTSNLTTAYVAFPSHQKETLVGEKKRDTLLSNRRSLLAEARLRCAPAAGALLRVPAARARAALLTPGLTTPARG